MLNKVKSLIPNSVKKYLRSLTRARAFVNKSYGQEGEDLLLARIFNDGKPGTYVDVGAHHPFRFSNTYLFYQRGWHGINIDAMPGSMLPFHRHRRRDINLEMGIALQPHELRFHVFAEPALNTFDLQLAQERRQRGYAINAEVMVKCVPLSDILGRHAIQFDGGNSFLSVDVEGLDLEVLRSSDWALYRPSMVVVEILGKNLDEILTNETTKFLQERDYGLYAKLGACVIFKRNDFRIL